MAPKERRTLIGKRNGLSSRQRIFRTTDALEVEEVEGYDVTRRRVFFDDVLLVTYHQAIGWPFLVGMGVALLPALLMTLLASVGGWRAGLFAFAITVLPLLVLVVLRLTLRLDVVTVFGKRSKAQVQFWFRKQEARQLYQQVCRLAREHQERLARQVAAAAPRPPAPPAPIPETPA